MEALITDRLTIRPVEPADAEQVHAGMASDFEVVRHTGTWPWPADRDETARRCESGFNGKVGWAVALKGDVVVGTVGIGPEGEFGYMLPQAHWGQGYATEMGAALLEHVARVGTWESVNACVFEGNDASARVLEKLGFVEGAACRGRCEAQNGDFPIRTFTLTRWRSTTGLSATPFHSIATTDAIQGLPQ